MADQSLRMVGMRAVTSASSIVRRSGSGTMVADLVCWVSPGLGGPSGRLGPLRVGEPVRDPTPEGQRADSDRGGSSSRHRCASVSSRCASVSGLSARACPCDARACPCVPRACLALRCQWVPGVWRSGVGSLAPPRGSSPTPCQYPRCPGLSPLASAICFLREVRSVP